MNTRVKFGSALWLQVGQFSVGVNHHRLLDPIDYIPSTEADANDWREQSQSSTINKAAKTAALQQG